MNYGSHIIKYHKVINKREVDRWIYIDIKWPLRWIKWRKQSRECCASSTQPQVSGFLSPTHGNTPKRKISLGEYRR